MSLLKKAFLPGLAVVLTMSDADAAGKDVTKLAPYAMRASLFSELTEHRAIVMLGDSITARGEWSEFFSGINVANRGIGGDTTQGMLSRLGPVLKMKPKVVFIMAGVNDVARRRAAVDILDAYKNIIEQFTAQGTRVVIQSTLYVSRRSRLTHNVVIDEINKNLEDYCSTQGKCEFVDLNAKLSPEGRLSLLYTEDGVHLNGKGYMAWKEIIRPIMDRYRKEME